MRRFIIIAIAALFTLAWSSCEDVETYAEMKEKEKANIENFIRKQGIKVIDFDTFKGQGYSTDVEKNEYVLFSAKGVYMQIVRKGEGELMESGDRGVFMARYIEQNIETGDTISGNLYASSPDYFTCKCEGATYTASFTQGYMMSVYGTSAVPAGWLVPFARGESAQSTMSTPA